MRRANPPSRTNTSIRTLPASIVCQARAARIAIPASATNLRFPPSTASLTLHFEARGAALASRFARASSARSAIHPILNWCTGEDSNLRSSKERQIYSLLPLTTRPPVHYLRFARAFSSARSAIHPTFEGSASRSALSLCSRLSSARSAIHSTFTLAYGHPP